MNKECSCVWVGDYDSPDMYCAEMRTARRVHKCCECHGAIAPGSRYEHVAGKWDGRMDTLKTCVDCVSMRDVFFCDGVIHGDIWEALRGHLFEVGGHVEADCLTKLTSHARADVCDMIEAIWRDEDDDEPVEVKP